MTKAKDSWNANAHTDTYMIFLSAARSYGIAEKSMWNFRPTWFRRWDQYRPRIFIICILVPELNRNHFQYSLVSFLPRIDRYKTQIIIECCFCTTPSQQIMRHLAAIHCQRYSCTHNITTNSCHDNVEQSLRWWWLFIYRPSSPLGRFTLLVMRVHACRLDGSMYMRWSLHYRYFVHEQYLCGRPMTAIWPLQYVPYFLYFCYHTTQNTRHSNTHTLIHYVSTTTKYDNTHNTRTPHHRCNFCAWKITYMHCRCSAFHKFSIFSYLWWLPFGKNIVNIFIDSVLHMINSSAMELLSDRDITFTQLFTIR